MYNFIILFKFVFKSKLQKVLQKSVKIFSTENILGRNPVVRHWKSVTKTSM